MSISHVLSYVSRFLRGALLFSSDFSFASPVSFRKPKPKAPSLFVYAFVVFTTLFLANPSYSQEDTAEKTIDAKALIKAALDHVRGMSSYSEMTMIIHRPDWERSMTMRGWTRGEKRSLVRVVEPVRDAGSGTLLVDNQMWTYTPKINRVIKVPGSMMNQSWMGSDFSNNEVARSDDVLDDYNHSLLSIESVDGHQVYVIQAIPHENAAVVWGREVIKMRDDYVILQHDLYDQDNKLVKSLKTRNIAEMDGRAIATIQRMEKIEEPEEWTELRINTIDFNVDVSDNLFTQSSLANPRL